MDAGTVTVGGRGQEDDEEETCRCFVQAPTSKFIVVHVRLGWCAKGHKIYTGSG